MMLNNTSTHSRMSDPEYSDSRHSRVIRMTPGRFANELIFRYAWIWLLALSLISVAGITLGIIVDIRWLLIVLMFVCIICPGLLAFLYYFHGMKRGCYVNTIPHRIVITEEGLILRLLINAGDCRSEDERCCESTDNSEMSSSETFVQTRDEFFPFSSLARFCIGKDSAIIPLKKPDSGFIWIPADAFNDEQHLSDLLILLDSTNELLRAGESKN